MKLSVEGLKNSDFWREKGYNLPQYPVEEVWKNTIERPEWLHIGAGNIFRAFPAVVQQNLLNNNLSKTGIIVCEAFDEELIDKAYRAYDNLSVVVTLKNTGEIEKNIVASVAESLKACSDYRRLVEIIRNPSLQIVTLTITEKGYAVKDEKTDSISVDIEECWKARGGVYKNTIQMITDLCYERYRSGQFPLALVSMDNFSHNGTVLKEGILSVAERGSSLGLYDHGFLDYLNNKKLISYNWSMIDKITPRPSEQVRRSLEADGLEDINEIITNRNTYTAAFVNTEEAEYLAIEDVFPNGRLPFEHAGIIISNRDVIDKIEKMKVCTCLNPLHTALAVFGCLLGYTSIADEMTDPVLKGLIEKIGYVEGLPVVEEPGVINSADFIKEVIEKRFPNPFLPDTPQRIASDTSKKIPIRFGETLKSYIRKSEADLSGLIYIPLFFAGWLRYLMAVDDNGEEFTLSPDPNIDCLREYLTGINLGDTELKDGRIRALLSREDIFGINLYDHGLGIKVEKMFLELISAAGAVKRTLVKYLTEAEE